MGAQDCKLTAAGDEPNPYTSFPFRTKKSFKSHTRRLYFEKWQRVSLFYHIMILCQRRNETQLERRFHRRKTGKKCRVCETVLNIL